MRVVFSVVVALFCYGQVEVALRQFEVASIKPAAADSRVNGGYFIAPGGRFMGVNITAARLIEQAYDVRDFQIIGEPGWLNSERYDIEGKAEGWSTPRELKPLVQALLADRFHLVVHQEHKDMPVYALLVDKGGAKFQLSKSNAGPGIGGGRGRINARQVSIEMFAGRLGQALGRPVVDKTGLKGEFDMLVEWTADLGDSAPGPSIFAALQEQLGLRLEAQRAAVPIIVIDRVEKPSGN